MHEIKGDRSILSPDCPAQDVDFISMTFLQLGTGKEAYRATRMHPTYKQIRLPAIHP